MQVVKNWRQGRSGNVARFAARMGIEFFCLSKLLPLSQGFVTPFSSSRHNHGGDGAPQRRYRRPCLDKETKMSSSAIRENIDSAGTTLTNRMKVGTWLGWLGWLG